MSVYTGCPTQPEKMPLSDDLGLHTSACMTFEGRIMKTDHVHLKYLKLVYEFKYAIVGHSIEVLLRTYISKTHSCRSHKKSMFTARML